jgi:AcrR family transcriptional regulator
MIGLGDCPPRSKNAAATRQAMLVSARSRFLQESYENVGLRDIAADAGVDVALVSRYFGSKEELFKEVLRSGREDKLPVEVGAADLPAYLTCMVLQHDREEDRAHVERLMIILRSASSPKAAEIVRDALRTDVLAPLAALLGGAHTEVRASLAVAVLMGATILRTIMAVEPLCENNRVVVDRKLRDLFKTALSGNRLAVTSDGAASKADLHPAERASASGAAISTLAPS